MSVNISRQYRRFSSGNLLIFSNTAYQAISTNTSIFTDPTVGMPAFRGQIDEYQSAENNAREVRSRLSIIEKKKQRKLLIAMLDKLAIYVLFIADGDESIIVRSGYALTKKPEPRFVAVPENFSVVHGLQPGQFRVSVKSQKRAAHSYDFQYSTDPELKEESWVSVSSSASKRTLTGLNPGTKYYLRVGVVGSRDQVLFSEVITKIAG